MESTGVDERMLRLLAVVIILLRRHCVTRLPGETSAKTVGR